MSNRIKEAFMLDEFEMELQRSGADYDEPEKVLKKFTQASRVSELREFPAERRIPGMFRSDSLFEI